MDKREIVKEYMVMTFGALCVAVAVNFFMVPGELVFGSASGLSLVLTQIIPIKMSVMNLILNVFFLLLGFFFVGKEFGGKTVFISIMSPVWMYILEIIYPVSESLTGEKWMDMLCCIFVVSAGQTFLFRVNASSGGLDIPAKMLNKYLHMELGRAVAFVGIITVLSAGLVYDITTVIWGIVGTYLNGRVVDDFFEGFSHKKRVSILSEKTKEIQQFIQEDINRGYTLYQAIGGYTKDSRVEIVTVLAKNEYQKLVTYIRKTDPNAFVTVSTVSDIVGIWNRRGKAYRL